MLQKGTTPSQTTEILSQSQTTLSEDSPTFQDPVRVTFEDAYATKKMEGGGHCYYTIAEDKEIKLLMEMKGAKGRTATIGTKQFEDALANGTIKALKGR